MRHDFEIDPESNRQHAENSCRCGENNRTGTLAAGLQYRLNLVDAFGAQVVIGVNQHNIIVHHHTRQSDHADPGHDDGEWLPHNHQSEKNTDGRHDHGGQDQPD